MVPRGGPGPRGPDARGRAGRRRGSPSCAARLASAILDAAAAAASASSSVFAARRWFLRAPSGGEAKQEPAGGKRKEGVERSRGPGLEGGSPRPSGAEKRRRRGPAPPPPSAAADPPRQRLCSPARRSACPSGHAGASPPLRESPSPPVLASPFPSGPGGSQRPGPPPPVPAAVGAPAPSHPPPSSRRRRRPRLALPTQCSGRRLFRRRAPGLRTDNMEAVKTFNSEVGIAVFASPLPLPRSCPRSPPRPPTLDPRPRTRPAAGGLGTGPQGFLQGGASGCLAVPVGEGCFSVPAPLPRSRGGGGGGGGSGVSSTYSRVAAGVEGEATGWALPRRLPTGLSAGQFRRGLARPPLFLGLRDF